MEYTCDLLGFFVLKSVFIPKEFSISPMVESDIKPLTIVFKESVKWRDLSRHDQRRNKWFINRRLKIPFVGGEVSSREVIKTIQTNLKYAKKIYVKGEFKQKFLQDILHDK